MKESMHDPNKLGLGIRCPPYKTRRENGAINKGGEKGVQKSTLLLVY